MMKKVLFILAITTLCFTAVPNCKEEFPETDAGNKGCSVCNDGYFKSEITALALTQVPTKKNWGCTLCPDGCTTCSDANTCLTCKAGWFIPPNPPTARLGQVPKKLCQKCMANCDSCKSEKLCDTCQEGFFKAAKQSSFSLSQQPGTENMCKACTVKGCKSCDNDVCSTCVPTKYPVKAESKITECKDCEGGCKLCTDKEVCSECNDKFFLTGSTCKACFKGCATCKTDIDNKCTKCETGWSKQEIPPTLQDVLQQQPGESLYASSAQLTVSSASPPTPVLSAPLDGN